MSAILGVLGFLGIIIGIILLILGLILKKKMKGGLILGISIILFFIAILIPSKATEDTKEQVEDSKTEEVENGSEKADISTEENILNAINNSLETDQLTTNYNKATIEKKLDLTDGVVLKEGGELLVAPEGTYFLELNMRANETDNDNAFAVDSNKKSIKALKSIMGLLEGNKISVIQINWYLPSKSLVNAESIYYILRFDTKTLLSIDWNTVDENNLIQYTSYVSEDYKEIN
ncbi:hypothetical protein ACH0B5_14380 [Ureibacillus sp. 179-F W5.1 NHS]|uniref:hypothetical protein n=1 Tax=Ureibacillus sp. 179-F W5.1 NHS TaxID=3374297 RepID=UPI003878FC44